MKAIFRHGGKQYAVQQGDFLNLDRFAAEAKSQVEISEVLAVIDGGETKLGTPFVAGAKVVLQVICEGKDRKVITFKKRRRKDSKTKRGFRRQFTRVQVAQIVA